VVRDDRRIAEVEQDRRRIVVVGESGRKGLVASQDDTDPGVEMGVEQCSRIDAADVLGPAEIHRRVDVDPRPAWTESNQVGPGRGGWAEIDEPA
jgi:hypothetical protein